MAKTEKRKCPVCDKKYLADPGRLKHGRETTCSRECSYALRGEKKATVTWVSLACSVCGTEREFPEERALLHKEGRPIYCSQDCAYRGRTLGLTRRVVTKPYVYTPKGKAALIASARKPKGQRVFHPDLTCAHCKKKFPNKREAYVDPDSHVYCSNKCVGLSQRGEGNPAWRGGHPQYYGPDWQPVRREARKRDKVCQRCGSKPEGKHLDVHHLRPVSTFKNPNDSNTLDNVVGLCHACHQHVEWNGIDFKLKFKPRYKLKYAKNWTKK